MRIKLMEIIQGIQIGLEHLLKVCLFSKKENFVKKTTCIKNIRFHLFFIRPSDTQ